MLKKASVLMFLTLLLTTSVQAAATFPSRPTTSGFVFDYQNVIDDDVEYELNEIAHMLQQQGIMELFLITVPTIGDLQPYEYGLMFFREWGIGDAKKDNGMVIYATTDMSKGNNTVRITTGYGLEGDYPDGKTGELLDTYMVPSLTEGDYTGAFAKVVNAIQTEEGIEYSWQNTDVLDKEPLSNFKFIAFLLVILVVVAGFLYFIFRFLQGIFFAVIEKVFKKDLRTEGYLKYLDRKKAVSKYIADHSDSDSSDSYSGGGGNSGGGGSDRSF